MKKQIVSRLNPNPEILPAQAERTLFFGVNLDEKKTFITRGYWQNSSKQTYYVAKVDELTQGHANSYASDCLGLLMEKLLERGHKIFQFDTFKELAAWLAE